MFKLHKHRSDKFGEKVEYKFSNLHASKVPRGWDRLMVSIVSVDTGKAIAKTSRAVVRNGNCQWSDTLKESVWISQDDVSNEHEDCLCKLVVSMGSARSGVLGEACLNLTDYINHKDNGSISLPLKKCSYDTVVQIKVQGLSPKTKFRDGRHLRESTSHVEDPRADADDMDSKSDESENILSQSAGSFSSYHPDESGNRSLSASGSHRSSDSSESYMSRTNFSPKNSGSGGVYNLIGRQDSTSSQNSTGVGDDICRSNHSSFNSKISGSQWPETNGQLSSHSYAPRHSDSSKEFLEAAQETIEELRGESRMWEKTARKFKGDLEALKKEFSDQSNHQSELDMELSTACSERDSLKLEVEQLKLALNESTEKQDISELSKMQEEDVTHKQKELEDELKFQKESHANLALQMKKTQESNIELVLILQELEETIEKQRLEIANMSSHNQETGHGVNLCNKDMELKAEEGILNGFPVKLSEDDSPTGCSIVQKKEVELLKHKIQELEKDCAELTEENLSLIFKLNESTKDGAKEVTSVGSRSSALQYTIYSSNSELEQETEKKEILSEGVATEPLTIRFHDLEKKCTDLELDLQFFKDKACDLGVKLQSSQLDVEEKRLELMDLQRELENWQRIDSPSSDFAAGRNVGQIEPGGYLRMSMLMREMHKQLQNSIELVKTPWFESDDCGITEVNTSGGRNSVTLQEQAEDTLQDMLQLNKLLEEKIADCKAFLECKNLEIGIQNKNLIGSDRSPRALTLDEESKPDTEDRRKSFSLKEEDIASGLKSKRELEDLICDLRNEKYQLQESLGTALKESSVTSKYLDDLQKELMQLTINMDSQVLANKMLERKSMELESGKHELEFNLSELEQENVQLSERISGLEAQLRYTTNEKESNRLDLENSRSLVLSLKSEICKLEAEVVTQKLELKQKLQETQKKSSEAMEESEFLKISHSKLQSTVESLIDECTSLQKLNGDLRKQKLELHEKCSLLEVELSKSQEKSHEFFKKADSLECKLTSIEKDTTVKEKLFITQLEAICQEHKEHEEKLSKVQVLLSKMDAEKMNEVENLQREVAHLTSQMSSTHDERERIASDAVLVVSSVRADKNKLENNLHEVLSKVKSYEIELSNVRHESDSRYQDLTALLDASKQSEEMLMADIGNMRRLMEDVKLREEKFKRTANELELKLKASEYERQQLLEEISSVKVQLQKIPHLQEEISVLKSSIDESKFEKAKLENSLQLLSDECEEVKAEKNSCMEKYSTLQKALSDGEDARVGKVALEEKLLRLESDLTAVETLYAQDAELKNEINRIKRANSQYQRKILCLEEEKDDCMRRVQHLEKELKTIKEDEKEKYQSKVDMDGAEDHIKERHMITELDNSQRCSSSKSLEHTDADWQGKCKLEENNMKHEPLEGVDLEAKIHKLETELAEALHTNNMYQKQIQDFQSERQIVCTEGPESSLTRDGGKINNHDSKLSSLESELKDMQERYLQMSLRYAEVEAQREELVMKLKSAKKEKRWFS